MSAPPAPSGASSLQGLHPLVVAGIVTAASTITSYAAPTRIAATAVGIVFLAATWIWTLRDGGEAGPWGLALGGLLDRDALDPRRLLRDGARALAWALAFALVLFPPFVFGYRWWWKPVAAFTWRWHHAPLDDVAGQIFVVALPEEAFFRGYLQTALDLRWPPRWRIAGATLGPAWLVSAAIFAIGHLLTLPNPGRLAVFFPALVFGWLRARTGGIGAGVAFHAACNLFASILGRGFGVTPP